MFTMELERRNYCLNRNKAVNKKIKPVTSSLFMKNNGKCAIFQLNLIEFQLFSEKCVCLYSSNKSVQCVDNEDATSELKFFISDEIDDSFKVTLVLYNTKNKVMVQGGRASVRWWLDTHLPSLESYIITPPPNILDVDITVGPDSPRLVMPLPPTPIRKKSCPLDIGFSSPLAQETDLLTAPFLSITVPEEKNDIVIKPSSPSSQEISDPLSRPTGIHLSSTIAPLTVSSSQSSPDAILLSSSPPIMEPNSLENIPPTLIDFKVQMKNEMRARMNEWRDEKESLLSKMRELRIEVEKLKKNMSKS